MTELLNEDLEDEHDAIIVSDTTVKRANDPCCRFLTYPPET